MSDEEEELSRVKKKPRKIKKNEFVDDEAELSGDEPVSEDELESSDDDDKIDLDLIDKEAKELDSDQEEEVRGFYHKQLETEDRRAVLLLKEQLEDKAVDVGQRRRRKFRWQTKELMENSLRRHYDPDDDDSQEGDEDDDDDYDDDYDVSIPRGLRRPTAEALLIGSTRIVTKTFDPTGASSSSSLGASNTRAPSDEPVAGPSAQFSDDSNSQTISSRLTAITNKTTAPSDLNRFLFRDREIVEALSTRETIIATREEKDRVIQRELKRVLTSKSIFDQLYS